MGCLMSSNISSPCILCGSSELWTVSKPGWMKAVTSDCKPWPRLGSILFCKDCGHLQKRPDSSWKSDVNAIYTDYEIYALSSGIEQVIFREGGHHTRSESIAKKVMDTIELPETGRALDVGCGNGSWLKVFKKYCPEWKLAGFEPKGKYRAEVLAIAGENGFRSGDLDEVEDKFNLITLLHVIEHLSEPVKILKNLRAKLDPGGFMIVQTTDLQQNPFDLLVIDHCSHFSKKSLARIMTLAGFEVIRIEDSWIPKELSLLARVTEDKSISLSDAGSDDYYNTANKSLNWLEGVVEHARRTAKGNNFGIFGTAIAGTWLAMAVGSSVSFFVDEDPHRNNKYHMELPVLKPDQVPKGSSVYLAFPPAITKKIHQRLSRTFRSVNFIVPPDFRLSGGEMLEGKIN